MKKELNWVDYASIIIGIMLGTGIFTVFPTLCAGKVPALSYILMVWLAGGIFALFGAMSYAELALRYPYNGGDYLYLKEAYTYKGYSPLSFLFGWVQILVIRPASIISMALVFSANVMLFIQTVLPMLGVNYTLSDDSSFLYLFVTFAVLAFFTFTSVRGISLSKKVQRTLTLIKLITLLLIIIVGFISGFIDHGTSNISLSLELNQERHPINLMILALIPIMWVYGGWNEASYATGEVKETDKNIPMGLFTGVISLTILYVLVNFIYVLNLGAENLGSNWAFTTDLMDKWFGPLGAVLMPLVIIISVAGAINGMIFIGGRMTESFCSDVSLLNSFARRDLEKGAPVRSLILNLIIIIITIISIQFIGKLTINKLTESIESLLYYTSGVVWLFFFLIVASLFIFRRRENKKCLSYRVPFSPLPEIMFLVLCILMVYGALDFRLKETLIGFGIFLIGIPVYFVFKSLSLKRINKNDPS